MTRSTKLPIMSRECQSAAQEEPRIGIDSVSLLLSPKEAKTSVHVTQDAHQVMSWDGEEEGI